MYGMCVLLKSESAVAKVACVDGELLNNGGSSGLHACFIMPALHVCA